LIIIGTTSFCQGNGVPSEDLVPVKGRAALGHLLHGRERRWRHLVQQRKTLRGKTLKSTFVDGHV